MIDDGRITKKGSPEDIINDPTLKEYKFQ